MFAGTFKGYNSLNDMQNVHLGLLNKEFKINAKGISDFTTAQIQAKAAAMGLTDSITTELIAIGKDATFTQKAASKKITWGEALKDNSIDIHEIGDALKDTGKISEKDLNWLNEVSKNTDAYRSRLTGIVDNIDGLSDSFIDLGKSIPKSTGFLDGLKNTFTGITAAIKPLVPLLVAAGTAIAAYEGFKLLDDKFTLTFKTAQEHLEESSSAYANTVTELENLNSQTDQYKSTLQSIGSNYEIKFSGTETINEMIEKLRSVEGGLDVTDEATINKLQRENSLLETRKDLLSTTADTQQKQAAEDARKSINFASEEISFGGQNHRPDGSVATYKVDRERYVREQISEMEKAQKQIEEAQEKLADKSTSKADRKTYKKQFEQATENLEKYRTLATEKLAELNEEAENFYDKQTKLVIDGYEDDVKKITSLNDSLTNFDLSPAEKNLSQIESFFNGSKVSNSIKDSIIKMLKSGEVDNATDALHKMGVTLNDLGITSEGKKAVFDDYFKGLVDSAKEAGEAMKNIGIDGSVDGVKKAFETENQDSDWNSMTDFLKQAQELYKNGKVGTDDFKAAAQFMSPSFIDPDSTKYDADAYVAAWEAAYDKVQRYFNAENPAQSVANFTDDLVSKELAVRDGDDVTWLFKNSAEAAKELELSVEATEALMHNLEAYGAEFDDVMFSGEGLKDYEIALEKIKSIRDSMNNEYSKERLDKLIENWDSDLEGYQNDLSTLTEDQVIRIEFEYDMSELQSEIDELQSLAKEGDTTVNASLNYKKSEYRERREKENGYDESKDELYSESYKAVENLQGILEKTKGQDNRAEIQEQISSIYDLQNAFQDALSDGEAVDWESFLGSDNARKIIDDIVENTELSKDKIADMLNVNSDLFKDKSKIHLSYEVDTSEIESRMADLASGSTISFKANVDNVETTVTALKNEDGTISYTADVGDAEKEVHAIRNEDGTITYTVNEVEGTKVDKSDESIKKTVDEVEGTKVSKDVEPATQVVDQLLGKQVPTEAPDATQRVNRFIGTDVGTSLPSITQIVNREIVEHEASGTLLAPSHVNGTAYNMLNLQPAYANGKVSLPRDESALVNELGTESLIRDGVWSLLPGKMHIQSLKKGDIILNAKQTKDLLESGKTNSHARAYANGTLLNSYANGFRIPSGVINNSSYSSNLNNASNSNTSSAAANVAKAAEDLKDFVEIWLDRASDITQKQIDAIDRAVGLANKQNENAKAISNVQSEITKNRQAYDRYMQQANSVGLSESYASQIRDGSLNIENITDETLSKNIKSYEEWYNKAKDCLDKVTELQDKERELAIERLEQIEDFYKLVNDVQEALQDANDAKLEFSEAMGFSAVSDAVRKTYQESLNAAEEIYTNLSQQLTDYQNEFNDLISKGYIQKYSDAWYEGYAKIHEFNEAIDSAGVSIVDFEDKIREITYTKIQQLIDGFERAMDKLDARIELMESRDETVPESLYQKQLDANNSRITGNKQMRDAKLEEQALYAVDSERYQELAEEINKLDTETLSLMKDNEKLKDTIFELRFTPLEDGIEKMESLRGELKDFMNLLNEDAYFDKEGRITSEGVAALALLEQSMSSAKQEIADYRKGLEKLQESFDNGVISEVEFNEKSEEYRKGIRDSIADVQDYSEALTDLYLNQMKQENEYLQKIIDKRKEALKAKAEYYDYDKKIRSQSKDVNMLKSQIAALEGVNSASAQAELKRLKQQLSDAEEELSETKRDHAIDMQEKGYDAMSDELNEILENTEYEIVHNADKQQSVIQSMLQNVVSMYSSAYGKINEIIHNTGWVGSTDFNSNQSSLGTQEGAANQVSGATQHQTNVGSTGTAQSTVTSPIKNNDSFNHDFEQEIYKDPNVDNRPVAELKLSKKSITLEEGKSTSISVQIRPTDAKNKTLSWKSSNEKVATVSNGTIKAVKPGSCQITASTTDGSGISASVGVTVTKKPDPPKPVVNTPSSSGGDGVPRVGDVVTLLAGQRYYHSSWGTSPAGNRYAGVPNGVVIDGYSGVEYGGQSGNHGDYGIHIRSADGVYGDLGWVSLSQITGYNKGTRKVPKDGLALFDETTSGKSDPGSEVIVTKHGTLKQFDAGDTVFANTQVQRLYEASKTGGLLDTAQSAPTVQTVYTPTVVPVNNTQNVEVNIGKLLTIEDGVITKDTIPDVKKAIKDCIPMIKKEVTGYLYTEARKVGMRR